MKAAAREASRDIRLLVVGRSALRRQALIRLLREAGGFEIIGEITTEPEAIERAARLKPALVAVDVDLDQAARPLQMVQALTGRAAAPVVVVTSRDQVRSQQARELLHAGAAAVIARPPETGDAAFLRLRRELVTAVRAACPMSQPPAPRVPPANSAPPPREERPPGPAGAARRSTQPSGPGKGVSVVAVAASTGGPAALRRVLGELPSGHPPVLVVQHIGEGFAESLTQWLGECLPHSSVRIAKHGEVLHKGDVLIAPSHRHLAVSRGGRVELLDTPPVANHKPAANVLFESLASAYGARTLAVVLTGMGRDGADGLLRLWQTGAHTIAQDAASSIVHGMPGAAAQIGAVSEMLPLDRIGAAIAACLKADSPDRQPASSSPP